ncbi:hypothetical protein K461DRAFT_274250 [Myriangium duriaei CBS 260.36]|uniref:Acyltransferase 3 domain-containing protein n=1 Tax=Myriangium duriaei CBS 260.36 TaxID=1168546 RepID=A0A9P4J9Y3_9PEZI|nr:hypothetical protein K461DRAFT_274250 [Myriangium duriaei CBS 260.36]
MIGDEYEKLPVNYDKRTDDLHSDFHKTGMAYQADGYPVRPDVAYEEQGEGHHLSRYDSANAMLLGEGHKPTNHTSIHGSLWSSWHRVTRMRRSALLRAIFNYPEPDLKLRNTAWLDGLRGLAAFEVFIFHYCDGWIDRTTAWGTGEYSQRIWYYLPFIRSTYNGGDAAVCLFFAISGYALSYRMLIQMRRGQHDQLLSSLSSSIFRRGIRLYTPVLAMTFILMITARLGLPRPAEYELAPTLLSELSSWYWSSVWLLLPLWKGLHWERAINRYDGGISWTIPMEYYGSIQVYTAILFLCRTRSILVRRALTLLWVAQRLSRDDWSAAQFLLGMTFADYHVDCELRRKARPEDRWDAEKEDSSWDGRLPPPKKLFLMGLFVFGLFLSGLPGVHWISKKDHQIHSRLFYDWITKPFAAAGLYDDYNIDRYIMCLASICIFVAIGQLTPLKKITEMRFVQYLGRISFGLYLCHVTVRAWLVPLKSACLGIAGVVSEQSPSTASNAQYVCAYIMMMIPATAINFIAAGLFERLLDRPSVNLGKTFEVWCLSLGQETAAEPLPLQVANGSLMRQPNMSERRD